MSIIRDFNYSKNDKYISIGNLLVSRNSQSRYIFLFANLASYKNEITLILKNNNFDKGSFTWTACSYIDIIFGKFLYVE